MVTGIRPGSVPSPGSRTRDRVGVEDVPALENGGRGPLRAELMCHE